MTTHARQVPDSLHSQSQSSWDRTNFQASASRDYVTCCTCDVLKHGTGDGGGGGEGGVCIRGGDKGGAGCRGGWGGGGKWGGGGRTVWCSFESMIVHTFAAQID